MSEDRIVRKWALLERSNNRVRNGRLGKKILGLLFNTRLRSTNVIQQTKEELKSERAFRRKTSCQFAAVIPR